MVDVSGIPSYPTLHSGETLTYTIISYLNPRAGTSYKPVNTSISSKILNESFEIMKINQIVIEGKQYSTITINTSILEPGDYRIDIIITHDIFSYTPQFIGNITNISLNNTSIHLTDYFIIERQTPQKWRIVILGSIVGLSGVTFGVSGYFVFLRIKRKSEISLEKHPAAPAAFDYV
jgi:hypothetical protein